MKTLYLAGGCFWGMQKFIDQFDGVISTEVGYANGPDKAPTYEEVCNDSGHAETLKIDYDETKISGLDLVRYFFMVIDPLSVNKQGGDEGCQGGDEHTCQDEDYRPFIVSEDEGEHTAKGSSLLLVYFLEPCLRSFPWRSK